MSNEFKNQENNDIKDNDINNIETSKKNIKINIQILSISLLLSGFGILMVYSSSFYFSITSISKLSYASYFSSSIKYFIIACLAMYIGYITPIRIIKKLSLLGFFVSIFLLFALPILGTANKGATRWISLGAFTIQPSEIAKVGIILFISYISDYLKKYKKNINTLLFLMLVITITSFLIKKLSNDLSSSILVFVLGIMGISSIGYNIIKATSAITLLSFPILYYLKNKFIDNIQNLDNSNFRIIRIKSFIDTIFDKTYAFKEENYQQMYSIYAIAEGSILGCGLGAGLVKTRLPEPYSDFIFAVICEEMGFLGAAIVIISIFIIVYNLFMIAKNSKDDFCFTFSSMTGFMIGSQTILNIFVVTGLAPVTGVTLPFLSRGGSSLLIIFFCLGICLNIDLNNKLENYIKNI